METSDSRIEHLEIRLAIEDLNSEFVDEYLCSSDGKWRIQKRHIERIFTVDVHKGPLTMTDK